MELPSPLRPLLTDPSRSAILTDFDGTLGPVVDDPKLAVPLPGAVEVLHRLARRFAMVGVVSGRPVSYLVDRLGTDLWLSGLYGLERWEDGQRVEAPEAERWRPVVAEATARAETRLGPLVEAKGLSLTLHFRTVPERGDEARAWAREEAQRTGLVVTEAKASVELHPPVDADKGTVVEAVAAGMGAACFFGDDVGDLSAFGALERLAAAGVATARVAVNSAEADPELLERADVVVDGPTEALAVLEALASG
ncbi:MAG: trehalose-phosphatase [Actinobacteria bacterium]|nr:trehalose-phosphatase [Actinomycetota bacterium]